MTGWRNVWKVDKDLNILINYNPGGYPYQRVISYNPSNGFIYVVANSNLLKEIHVFKLDLVLIRRFSTKPYQPWSTTELSNKLYVGTEEGIILVYQNEKITSQFNGCDGNSVLLASILFDPNGYMATTFSNPSTMYLFSQNGSFTGIVPY